LAFFAHADAFGADAGDVFEGEVDDAALAGGHGIEAEWLAGAFDAFGGDFGGHAEFFEAQGAVAAAIDVNFFVESGFETESAECEMLDGFEDFGVSFEQDFFVAAVEVGDDFGVAFQAGVFGRNGADGYFQLEAGGADAVVEKFLQRFRGGGAIEFAVANEVGDHKLLERSGARACVTFL
jgi:hypothetical protein